MILTPISSHNNSSGEQILGKRSEITSEVCSPAKFAKQESTPSTIPLFATAMPMLMIPAPFLVMSMPVSIQQAMITACKEGNLFQVQQLLNTGINSNFCVEDEPLLTFTYRHSRNDDSGHKAIVDYLLHIGVNPNAGKNHKTLLTLAYQANDQKMMQILLQRPNIIPRVIGQEGRYKPLAMVAYQENKKDLVDFLIAESKNSINEKDENGETLLSLVYKNGDVEKTENLLKQSYINANIKVNSQYILMLAYNKDDSKIMAKLLERGAWPEIYDDETHYSDYYETNMQRTLLIKAYLDKKMDTVDLLLKHHVNVNIPEIMKDEDISRQISYFDHGKSLLEYACEKEDWPLVKRLISEYNADFDIKDMFGVKLSDKQVWQNYLQQKD